MHYWNNLLLVYINFILLYWSRESMVCGLSFACASMEVPACESTFFWV